MISNERPSPYGFRPSFNAPAPKPHVQEDTLKTVSIQVERKIFIFTLKENPRGRFLRITEQVGGRRESVIIPSSGLEDFQKIVHQMVGSATELPQETQQ